MSKHLNPITSRRDVLKGTAAGVVALSTAAAAVAHSNQHPDAELLRLGSLMGEAIAKEVALLRHADDETLGAAMNVVGEIVDRIILLPATTLDGLRVKARALWWCCGFDFEAACHTSPDGHCPTDVRIMDGILRDLLGAVTPGEPA
jgi:hypothetical protein